MYLLGLKYIEALPTLTQGKGNTVFLPVEASGIMGAIGALKEMLKSGSPAEPAPAKSTGALPLPPRG
jgi:hypothetical protein